MSTRLDTHICEIRGCGQVAAVVMQAPTDAPGKAHALCQTHASWMATKLMRAGVEYTSRPVAAA